MAGSLKTSHHKLILLGDGLHHTVLLLFLGDFVTDVVEIEFHVGEPLALASSRALDSLVHKTFRVSVRVMTSFNSQSLLDVEANSVRSDLAVGVVNMDFTSAHLSRHELVLFKHAPHRRGALIAAAPGLDLASLLLFLTHLESNGLLTDDENLLVLHHIVLVVKDLGLDVVLDLGLRLFARVLVLESKRRGDAVGQGNLEVDLVDTRIDHSTRE